jgi:hypothetical protein
MQARNCTTGCGDFNNVVKPTDRWCKMMMSDAFVNREGCPQKQFVSFGSNRNKQKQPKIKIQRQKRQNQSETIQNKVKVNQEKTKK